MLAAARPYAAAFNVSPKLASSRVPAARRIRPGALSAFAASSKAVFKFVACTPADFTEVADLEARFGLAPIWIMPEGVTSEKVPNGMRDLADEVLQHGWHLTGRMQVLLWGDVHGRRPPARKTRADPAFRPCPAEPGVTMLREHVGSVRVGVFSYGR